MKSTNPNPSLEELLASVEHAGRDARRQQQLAEMVEGLAAKEDAARRRVVRLWTARIAAAACLLGVIFTIVHYINLPVASTVPMLAEVRPMDVKRPSVAKTPEAMQPSVPLRQEHNVVRQVYPTMELPERLPDLVEEESLIVLTEVPELAPVNLSDFYADVAPEQFPTEALAQAETVEEPKPTERAKRRSIFSIGNSEPDLMEGNTLSIRLI